MKIEKIIAADLCGNDISANIKLEYTELDGVTACYADGKAENGFRGDEAFVLAPAQSD